MLTDWYGITCLFSTSCTCHCRPKVTRYLSLHEGCKIFHTNFHVPNVPPYALPVLSLYKLGLSSLADRILPYIYDEFEIRGIKRGFEYRSFGNAYYMINSTKPSSIGYGMYQNPAAILSYFLDKFETWTDPRSPAFQPPGKGNKSSGVSDEGIL
jgi:hypothetical protein